MPRDLAQGTTGDDVRTMQTYVNYHLQGTDIPPLVPDGIFGPKTRAAVLRIQQIAHLTADGIVGPKTRAALINVGATTGQLSADNSGQNSITQAQRLNQLAQVQQQQGSVPPPSNAVGQATPTTPPATPPKVSVQGVVVQAGSQFSWNPWAPSPFVVGAQANILFRLSPLIPPLQLSPGFQFFKNGVNSPNGPWTGQGFIQLGPTDVIPPAGNVDWFNPFVQGFVQKNFGQSPQAGFAFGDQVTWKILGDKLGLFANGQVVFGWDLNTGQGQPVAVQVFGGLQVDLVQLLSGK